jgi:SAM-dependent methyltransferase
VNQPIKSLLKKFGVYYSLQSYYRRSLNAFLIFQSRYRYRKYAGSGFTCNVCQSGYSRFIPSFPAPENAAALQRHKVIAGYGEQVICPFCRSTARERLVLAVLQDQFNLKDKLILHFAPEAPVYKYLNQEGKVITADIEPGFYRNLDKHCREENLCALSFENDLFDWVICNHVMEHIKTDSLAVEEIYRVMKPGGQAILQVPYTTGVEENIEIDNENNEVTRSPLYGQKDHVRIYALKAYLELLKAAGFILHVQYPEELKKYQQFAIQPGECAILVQKPVSA